MLKVVMNEYVHSVFVHSNRSWSD